MKTPARPTELFECARARMYWGGGANRKDAYIFTLVFKR
jgi:hypothetical protein